jgi:hypothetical protein
VLPTIRPQPAGLHEPPNESLPAWIVAMDLQVAKSAVFNNLSCPDARHGYAFDSLHWSRTMPGLPLAKMFRTGPYVRRH